MPLPPPHAMPLPPPPAMPLPSASASASAIASRLATHWIAQALAGDESLDTSVFQELVRALKPFAGASEATRERVALLFLQEASSVIPAGGDAATTAGVPRFDGARSREDAVFRFIREVAKSGELEKELLPPSSQDIQKDQKGAEVQPETMADAVSIKSKEGERMPTPPTKRKPAHPQKRHPDPVAAAGKRRKLWWTEEEEATLKEGMSKFSPQNDGPIPWTLILEYGRAVFHTARRASDLRVKWRNLQRKERWAGY